MVEEPAELEGWGRAHLAAAAAVVAAVVLLRWVPLLDEPFWLDETGTWWFARSAFLDALDRAGRFQAGSFLFHAIEWPFAAVFGRNEVALRVPPFVASLLSTWMVYRLGTRLFDRGVGALGAICFVPMTWVIIQATDARPYALAVASLVGSALALVRWFDTGARRDALAYAVLAAGTVHLHYFVALGLISHIWYVALRLDTGTSIRLRQIGVVFGGVGLLLLPLVPNIVEVASVGSSLSAPNPMSPSTIAFSLLPERHLLVGALAVLVAAGIWGYRPLRRLRMKSGSLMFLGAWIAFPCLALMSIAYAAGLNVTPERYFSSVLPPVALLFALITRGIGLPWAQVGSAAVFAAFAMWRTDLPPNLDEDWRAAAEIVRTRVVDEDTPVLLHSGYIEGAQIDWLRDPERSSYLNAPASMYPMEGDLVALPYDSEAPASQPYLESLLTRELGGASHFVLVQRSLEPYSVWFDERLRPEGYTMTFVSDLAGQIQIYEFTRRGPSSNRTST